MRHRHLWRYGPLVLWAALIFVGSTDLMSGSNTRGVLVRSLLWLFPNLSEANLGFIHFAVRKVSHFAEYAVLALLAARAFRTSSRDLLRNRWFWVSLLLVVVFSLSDEFHQSFTRSRKGSIYDCLIDSLGGLTALLLLAFRKRSKPGQDFTIEQDQPDNRKTGQAVI
jgi:VanZ family protein